VSDSNDPVLADIERFFERWGKSYEEMAQSFRDTLTGDCKMRITSFPAIHGPEEGIEKVLEPSRKGIGMETIRVEMLHISLAGDLVWCERIDHLTRGDGSEIAAIPIMAIMELDGEGKIEKLREYPDTSHRHPDALKFVEKS
jgi:limonene-1,2-epoxide hydrolase